jgi:aldose 1-epimerase
MPSLVGERSEDGMVGLTLECAALGGVVATFVPEAGMIGCSLRHRGEELLGQRGGLRRYVESFSTMGIPFLHPWANRLGGDRFELGGRQVDLTLPDLPLKRDAKGLPMHGLLSAAPGWQLERHAERGGGGVLAASFDFGAYPHLLEAFPFPHRVGIEATLAGTDAPGTVTLTVATTVRASGEVAVPVSFGFHPYLALPGVRRAEWLLEAPVHTRLALDERQLPTGAREPATIEPGPLGTRTYDDAFLAPRGGEPFVLVGGSRRLELRLGEGFPFTQLYAPSDTDAVAIEPMTAPTDTLRSGADLPWVEPGETFAASWSLRIASA